MAHEARLIIGNIERQLLTFQMNHFKVQNTVSNKWCDENMHGTLDSLYAASRSIMSTFYSKNATLFGGLFDLTMESTDDDVWLYDWFVPNKNNSTIIKHGRIDFFGEDEFYPFKRIEFWDAWITNISESMSATGKNPMIMSLRLSPATIRYNNDVVHRKVWFITDIDRKVSERPREEKRPKVVNIYWMDEEEKKQITEIKAGQTATFVAETRDYEVGEPLDFNLKNHDTGEMFTLSGEVGDWGTVKIKWTNEKKES